MNKKARTILITQMLNDYFPHPPIPLKHSSPYTLLIAVLLSAQCTDDRVNQITPTLFEEARTPEAMSLLSQSAVEEIIRPCGLGPTKAKNILALSKILSTEHGGEVPQSFQELEALPGVGHKTASVVMSQAFGHPAFPVDTHIHRLAKRWKLTEGKNVSQTESDLKKLFPKSSWNNLHLQIIFYARKFCPARGHRIDKCPICNRLQSD